ncbi:MAG: MCE family protein [bacterium]|nr:MCE family protein [bacterium]
MAADKTNHWKLGLFVVLGVLATIASLFWIAASRLNRPEEERVTYFNESVQGLEVGAPVKFRGVTVGKVSAIGIAPDRRLVQVTSKVYADVLEDLGLVAAGGELEATVPSDMRVQLSSTGITGVKFLLVDFFPRAADSPSLEFTPAAGFMPSTSSTLKSVEDSLRILAENLPAAMTQAEDLLATVNQRVKEFDVAAVSGQAERFLSRLNEQIDKLDEANVIVESSALMADLRRAAALGRELLERLRSDEDPIGRALAGIEGLTADARGAIADADVAGTARSVRDASASYGALAGNVGELTHDLQVTVRHLQETLDSIDSLAEFLERQPGSILRGRTPDIPPTEQ